MQPIFDFLESPARNRWVAVPGVEVYLRKEYKRIRGMLVFTLTIANVVAVPEGKGNFKAMMLFLEGLKFNLYVENIHNIKLQDMLSKHGYILESKDGLLQAYKLNLKL